MKIFNPTPWREYVHILRNHTIVRKVSLLDICITPGNRWHYENVNIINIHNTSTENTWIAYGGSQLNPPEITIVYPLFSKYCYLLVCHCSCADYWKNRSLIHETWHTLPLGTPFFKKHVSHLKIQNGGIFFKIAANTLF